MNLNKYIILLLVRNLDQGDGTSIAAIDHNFFRISVKTDIDELKIDNIKLHEIIEGLLKDGKIFKNRNNNYVIDASGESLLLKHSILKDKIKQLMTK